MAEPSLDILGVVITNPLAKLRRKFGFDAPYVPFDCFDGYATPAEKNGRHNELEMEDLLITVAMNSRIGANVAWSFWQGIKDNEEWYIKANDLLTELSSTLELANATEEQVEKVVLLFDTLDSVPGIGTAVAGKILCRKRPRIAPMLDSFVLPIACHLSLCAEGIDVFSKMAWSHWYDTDRAIRHFQRMCKEGKAQLHRLCNEFRDLLPGKPNLAALRALESLLWWETYQEPECGIRQLRQLKKWMGWGS